MTRKDIDKLEENLKKVIATNLKRIMKEKDLSQAKLSERSKIPKSTISDYITEKTLASPGNVQKLADALNISKKEIDPSFENGMIQESTTTYGIENIKQIPIIGSIAAGTPVLAVENIEGYMPVLSTLINPHKEYFYLVVKGNSMNQEFADGSYVLVEKSPFVENGQIGVVLVNSSDATVKKVSINENIITLIPMSTDPTHQPKIFDLMKDDIIIIGRVVQAVKVY
jgi:repressor LexA